MGKLFQKEFKPGKNYAHLGWEEVVEEELPVNGMREFGYIMGYLHAAEELTKQAKIYNYLIYPALFSYRQYIELVLKNLNQQLKKPRRFNNPHDLKEIWDSMCNPVRKQYKHLDEKELEFIRDIVYEFADVDPKSSNFRYFAKYGNRKTIDGELTVDLKVLKNIMRDFDGLLHFSYDN